ncbi:MAG TPA: hypothetical protein H9741_01470 [Candidatus Borkfalkia faecipullorum]|uniref:Uncharacterized protein n=1 Tax=Candidatus Borkfalkia faecipullorum TaxID=2838510 RepID=A0A9D2AFQ2_9FIRM|nr:hypothetical protein [Candidatus Borkfalkia faecipullorum]
MKKKLIRIVSLVMTAMLALGLFSGCSLGIFSDMGILVTDNQRDMQQVVAEVNLGKDKTSLEESFSLLSEELNSTVADQLDKVLTTDEIYKRDLVAYFMSYGYNYYSQNNSYTATFEQVMQDLVDRKIMSQFATVYYLNAGEVLVDRDNVTIKDGYVDVSGTDGMKMNGEISLDGYLSAIEGKTGDEAAVAGYSYLLTDAEIKYATYVIMVSVNSAIDSYEEDYIKAEDETTSSTETRTTPTGANTLPDGYYPTKEDGSIDYAIYTGANSASECGEYEKKEGSTSYTRSRAYAQFIHALRENYLIGEDEKDVTDVTALSYFTTELKSQLEQMLINKFYATLAYKAAQTMSATTLQESYQTLLNSQEASTESSSFTTTMDSLSDTSFVVYSPKNRKFGFVYNILLPFNTNQTKLLDSIRYTDGTKEYYAARNTNAGLLSSIEAKDQRASWFNGSEDYSFEATGDYYKNAYNSAEGKTNYLFFKDSYVENGEGIERYAGKYPFNGTAEKKDDGTYKLTYNLLDIDGFIDEMESYIGYVTENSSVASGKYYSGTLDNLAQWNAADKESSTFYSVTADYFPKDANGVIDQSANIYYKGSVSNLGFTADGALDKTTNSYKVISAVNELMFAYSTDTGCLNSYLGYSIAAKEEATSYVAEFEYAAQQAVNDGAGVGNYYVVATDYGWHIIYVSFVYTGGEVYGGFDYNERNTEGTFSYYFYQSKKSSTVTEYGNNKETMIRYNANNDTVVTLHKDRYEDLLNIA